MEIVKNEFCNECKSRTHLVVTGVDEYSIFAKCPICCASYDLIYDASSISQLVERKEITFTAGNDPEFGFSKQDVIILAGDILLDVCGDSWIFRVLQKPFTNRVDLNDCARFEIFDFDESVDLKWLAQASFLEVVRRFAN